VNENETKDVSVCFKAVLSLHGIGKILELIQKALMKTGEAPRDKRCQN
jgi:hypothetical protein